MFLHNKTVPKHIKHTEKYKIDNKLGEHAVVGKEMLKFGSIFGSLPDFPSLRP
jgi:hypothetical protein